MANNLIDTQAVTKSTLYAPHLPWNTYKVDEIGPNVMEFMRDTDGFYRHWAKKWFEVFQFVYSNHNVKWSKKNDYAVDVDFMRPGNSTAQTSSTNLARVVVEALASMIYSNLPGWEVQSGDESQIRGKRYTKIIQRLLDAYMERLCMDKEFTAAALIYTSFGQVGAKIDWQKNIGKLIEVPKYQKVQGPSMTSYMAPNPYTGGLFETPTQMLDSKGQPASQDRWEAVVDHMGRQVMDKILAGDGSIRIMTPFEYRREIGSHGLHKSKFVEDINLMDYDDYLDQYGQIEGQTKHFKQIRPMHQSRDLWDFAMRHYMRMQFVTPPTMDDGRKQGSFNTNSFKHKVLVVEHWDRPHTIKWPTGRRLVIVNGVCTHVTAPSYSTNKMDGWHPYAEAQWMVIPPSSIATGPTMDVVNKNRELNVLDSLISTSIRRNMGSTLLTKIGSGIDPGKISGTPGQIQEVQDPFAARWLHDEMPIPPVIHQLRQNAKDDVFENSGAMDALRGDRSVGANSGYHAKVLEEREEKRLAPARKNFQGFAATIGEKLFACVKTNVVKLDDFTIGYLKRCGTGEFQMSDVISLMSNPIEYGVEVTIKEASMNLRSKASHQANMMELANGPAAQRVTNDAKVLDNFLKEFDAENLRDSSSAHRDRANRENEMFMDIIKLGPDTEGVPCPIVMFEDDDAIHLLEHDDFAIRNSDELLSNEVALQMFYLHKERHRLQQQEKEGALIPGTSLQAPNFMAASRQIPTPTVQTIYQKTMMDQQAKAQQPPATAGGQPPQSPTLPPPQGQPGPGMKNPSAPSQNTSSAAKGGPPQ